MPELPRLGPLLENRTKANLAHTLRELLGSHEPTGEVEILQLDRDDPDSYALRADLHDAGTWVLEIHTDTDARETARLQVDDREDRRTDPRRSEAQLRKELEIRKAALERLDEREDREAYYETKGRVQALRMALGAGPGPDPPARASDPPISREAQLEQALREVRQLHTDFDGPVESLPAGLADRIDDLLDGDDLALDEHTCPDCGTLWVLGRPDTPDACTCGRSLP